MTQNFIIETRTGKYRGDGEWYVISATIPDGNLSDDGIQKICNNLESLKLLLGGRLIVKQFKSQEFYEKCLKVNREMGYLKRELGIINV